MLRLRPCELLGVVITGISTNAQNTWHGSCTKYAERQFTGIYIGTLRTLHPQRCATIQARLHLYLHLLNQGQGAQSSSILPRHAPCLHASVRSVSVGRPIDRRARRGSAQRDLSITITISRSLAALVCVCAPLPPSESLRHLPKSKLVAQRCVQSSATISTAEWVVVS